jgi:hypothetical protein
MHVLFCAETRLHDPPPHTALSPETCLHPSPDYLPDPSFSHALPVTPCHAMSLAGSKKHVKPLTFDLPQTAAHRSAAEAAAATRCSAAEAITGLA